MGEMCSRDWLGLMYPLPNELHVMRPLIVVALVLKSFRTLYFSHSFADPKLMCKIGATAYWMVLLVAPRHAKDGCAEGNARESWRLLEIPHWILRDYYRSVSQWSWCICGPTGDVGSQHKHRKYLEWNAVGVGHARDAPVVRSRDRLVVYFVLGQEISQPCSEDSCHIFVL